MHVFTSRTHWITLLVALCLFIGFGAAVAFASSVSTGWVWSSTIGWISADNTNDPNADLALVDHDGDPTTDPVLEGYMWSDNMGWLRFTDWANCPENATGDCQPRIQQNPTNPAQYEVVGWARFCSAVDNPATGVVECDAGPAQANAGGWDGWVSLSCRNETSGTCADPSDPDEYGWIIDTSSGEVTASTFAWGGMNVGWIDGGGPGAGGGLMIGQVPSIDSFTVDGDDEIRLGSSISLEWTVQGSDSCTASDGWSGSLASTNGTHTQNVTPPQGNTTYTLTCTGNGFSVSESVTVLARPDIAITAFGPLGGWTPPAVGYGPGVYDDVELTVAFDTLGNLTDSASYEASFAGQTLSGTVDFTGGSHTFNPPLEFDNVPYGPQNAQIEIDLPAPGAIAEDLPTATPGIDEDVVGNSFTVSAVSVPVATPATLSIEVDEPLIRSEESTTISWNVDTFWDGTCEVTGNGVNESFSIVALTPVSGSVSTPNLTNETTYTITCTETTIGDSFSESVIVEIVPTVEER